MSSQTTLSFRAADYAAVVVSAIANSASDSFQAGSCRQILSELEYPGVCAAFLNERKTNSLPYSLVAACSAAARPAPEFVYLPAATWGNRIHGRVVRHCRDRPVHSAAHG